MERVVRDLKWGFGGIGESSAGFVRHCRSRSGKIIRRLSKSVTGVDIAYEFRWDWLIDCVSW